MGRFFAESKWTLAFELAHGASNPLRNEAICGLQDLFDVNQNDGAALQTLPNGEQLVALDATLAKLCHSSSNWYGDWHYRRGVRVRSDEESVEQLAEKDHAQVSEEAPCRVYILSEHRGDRANENS